jgi:hypothetical protein
MAHDFILGHSPRDWSRSADSGSNIVTRAIAARKSEQAFRQLPWRAIGAGVGLVGGLALFLTGFPVEEEITHGDVVRDPGQ